MSKLDQATTVDEVELPNPEEILAMDDPTTSKLVEKASEEIPTEKAEPEKPEEKPKVEPEDKKPEEAEKKPEDEVVEPDKKPEEEEKLDEQPEAEDEKERARRGYTERRQLKQKVTSGLEGKPEYTPQTAEELEAEGMDAALAGVEALRQEVRRDQIINELTELNASINTDANTVLRDFPFFDPKLDKNGKSTNPQYDEAFAKDVETRYKQYAHLEVDEKNGFITRADIPLYEFYAFAAQARGIGSTQAQVQGQKAAEKMLSASEEPSTGPEPSDKKAGGDNEEDLWLAGLKGEKGTYAGR